MQKLSEIYRKNVYGVMGTLVFHILLFSAFLLADVRIKGDVKEEEVLIEFPENLTEPESLNEVEETENNVDQERTETRNNQTNIASNRLAREKTSSNPDRFFDEDYMKEVEAAKQLRSNVSNQLSKEVVDLSELKMPVETAQEMTRDSSKNVIYAGDSNIEIYLDKRICIRLPVPVYLAQGGGKVIVDIVVDRSGKVTHAEPRANRSVRDDQIFLYAKEAAMRTIFNSDSEAPTSQTGSIHYTFVAQ